jgi:hypothetical protein
VGARENAHPQHIHVLLHDGGHDLLGRSVETRVDDVHPAVSERARHHLGAAVVAVEPDLGDQDPDPLGHRPPLTS